MSFSSLRVDLGRALGDFRSYRDLRRRRLKDGVTVLLRAVRPCWLALPLVVFVRYLHAAPVGHLLIGGPGALCHLRNPGWRLVPVRGLVFGLRLWLKLAVFVLGLDGLDRVRLSRLGLRQLDGLGLVILHRLS